MECGTGRTSPQSCPRRSALMRWAEELAKEGKMVDWHKLLPPRAFQVLPRRWVVERSFAWISHNRRMSLGPTRSCVQPSRRSRVRCHDSPHAEAIGSHLRLFHTVSPRTRVNRGDRGRVEGGLGRTTPSIESALLLSP